MFNEYWKTKAAKRRKKWAANDKRFAVQHAQLEKIRKKVFTPLDYNNTFSFEDYKVAHLVEQNSIAEWEQMKFRFSESGLREAMAAVATDANTPRRRMAIQRTKSVSSIKFVEKTEFIIIIFATVATNYTLN